MTPEQANKLRERYARAEKTTDSILTRLAASPYTAAILAAIAVLCIVLVVTW